MAQAIESAGKIGQVIGTGYGSPNTIRSYLKSGAFGFSVLWNPRDLGYLTVYAGALMAESPSAVPMSLLMDVLAVALAVSFAVLVRRVR